MDLTKFIRELRAEQRRIEEAISTLETLASQQPSLVGPRRGRKGMGQAERREVSLRMKKYWATRRRRSAAGGEK